MLAEKRGRFHLLRVSVFGKILSDHLLPLNDSVFHGPCVPSLENYGDVRIYIFYGFFYLVTAPLLVIIIGCVGYSRGTFPLRHFGN